MKEKHLWKLEGLTAFEPDAKPNVLLIGNGINRSFAAKSWEDLICDALIRNKSNYAYDDIKDMPATMQIVVATSASLGKNHDNSVKKEAQIIATNLLCKELEDKQSDLIGHILDLPIDAILNTNYSNEVELFATGCGSLHSFRSCQRRTKPVKGVKEQFRLFQFSSLGAKYQHKTLWHIHGDISKPSSMVIGHYYYGKLMKQIEDRAALCKRNHEIARHKGIPYRPESWVDLFLTGDVYVLGLGLYLTEQDLWWLLSFKQRHFPETRVFFYQAEKKMNRDVKKLLIAYGVEPVTEIPLHSNEYLNFYTAALKDIKTRIVKQEATHV